MLRKYGLYGTFRLLLSFIYTKLFFRKSRVLRLPIDIRNRKLIDFGKNLTTGVGCRIEAYSESNNVILKFGNNVQINDYVHITAMNNISIGDNVLMASKIYISDCTHGSYKGNNDDSNPTVTPILRKYSYDTVIIEENVWIGESVSILPGSKIGKSSIIGANSVVTSNIPEYCIAVGSPAKPIKKFNFQTKKWEKII